MPYSANAGKDWIARKLNLLPNAERILDIGAGSGTYPDLFRGYFPFAEWIGVEIWRPYVEEFGLKSKYGLLYIGDARAIVRQINQKFDVCFCGDVLEHMRKDEAAALIDELLPKCGAIFVSVPLGLAPQGAYGGNAFEEHVATYEEASFSEAFKNVVDYDVSTEGIWTIGACVLTQDPELRSVLGRAAQS